MIPGVVIPLLTLIKKSSRKLEDQINYTFSKFKIFFSNYMLNDKVFDRDVGQDTLIIIQIFTVFLLIIFTWEYFF